MVINMNSVVILSILVFLTCVDTSVSIRKPVYKGNDGSAGAAKVVDEKDVVILGGSNFSEYTLKNKYVMVVFYAPWCRFYNLLKPDYAKAATELKGRNKAVVLAKVDATIESELARKYDIEAYPTLYFFINSVLHNRHYGDRHKNAIIDWVETNMLNNLTTREEAKKILASGKQVALGYLNALVGSESNELSAASQMEDEDDVIFYQTTSSEVAKLFHIDKEVKRPALVLVKGMSKDFYYFGGEFNVSGIADFVKANKISLALLRYYNFYPIPEKNDDDVKMVDSNKFVQALRSVGDYLRQVWQVLEEY